MTTKMVFAYLESQNCCNCGVIFGLEQNHKAQLIESHRNFYCPAGHVQHFTGETDKDRAANLQQRFEEERRQRWAAEHRETLAKARLKRVKDRVANGVCPCCNRTFQNLHRHMKAEHPKFKNLTEPKVKP